MGSTGFDETGGVLRRGGESSSAVDLLGELGDGSYGTRTSSELGRWGGGALQGCFIGEGDALPLRIHGREGRGVPAKADGARGDCWSRRKRGRDAAWR